ncbi:MAG: hypothetical protein HZA51_06290 [Planctomycetes bacterium]|nr:hypothetical protein [Planctomycetota bacterium]
MFDLDYVIGNGLVLLADVLEVLAIVVPIAGALVCGVLLAFPRLMRRYGSVSIRLLKPRSLGRSAPRDRGRTANAPVAGRPISATPAL